MRTVGVICELLCELINKALRFLHRDRPQKIEADNSKQDKITNNMLHFQSGQLQLVYTMSQTKTKLKFGTTAQKSTE